MAWISDLISALTSMFTSLGGAILGFIKTGFETLFIDSSGTTPTVTSFGIFVFVLLGISIVMGLTYFITNFVRYRNR